jgi:glyoxylase-like metal-dependent hydrolase (beta-lactamase superfamily II)
VSAAVTRLVPLTVGWSTLPLDFFLAGEPGEIRFPVTAYLIDHPAGLTVFDTGLGPTYIRPDGAALAGKFDIERSGAIDARLEQIGVDPATITRAIVSHLHLDHAGGLALVPNARIVVQRAERDYAYAGQARGYNRDEFDTGQDFELVDGEYDLFGDGSVLLSPTPGHTPGHQSARVRTRAGVAVLAGDACNLRRSLDELRLPTFGDDLEEYRRSLLKFARWQQDGAHICFSHDPDFWSTMAPGRAWPSADADGR